jgi:hypothetical protein
MKRISCKICWKSKEKNKNKNKNKILSFLLHAITTKLVDADYFIALAISSNIHCSSIQRLSQFRPTFVSILFNVYCSSIWRLLQFHLTFIKRPSIWFRLSDPFRPQHLFVAIHPCQSYVFSNHMYYIHMYPILYSSNHMLC